MRQERLLLIFCLTLSFSLGSLHYTVRYLAVPHSLEVLNQKYGKPEFSHLEQAQIGLHEPAWFALKLNADPLLYLNTLSDLLKKVPLSCLGSFSEGDLIRIIMSAHTCRFSRSRLSGRTYQALGIAISINNASATDLMAVPKIGPKLAQKILAHRPYTKLDELLSLSGVGPKRLAQIEPYLTHDEPRKIWEESLQSTIKKSHDQKLRHQKKLSDQHIDFREVK